MLFVVVVVVVVVFDDVVAVVVVVAANIASSSKSNCLSLPMIEQIRPAVSLNSVFVSCSEPLFQTRSEHHRMITNACLHQ